jgi:hypothetical protein
MSAVTITEEKTFYRELERIKVNAPVAGLVVSNHEGFTIIPQVVSAGDNCVVAVRRDGLVKIAKGETVGLVLPLEEADTASTAAASTDATKTTETAATTEAAASTDATKTTTTK